MTDLKQELSRVGDNNRIVGGEPVPEDRFNFQAALLSNGFQYCGGSLIAPNVILSAGHCGAARATDVALGCTDLSNKNDCEIIKVRSQHVIPSYDDSSISNDLMIILLEEDSVQTPVQLVNPSFNFQPQLPITVTGWGTTSLGGDSSEILLGADVEFVPNDVCDLQYRSVVAIKTGTTADRVPEQIDDTMFCAEAPGKDACQGDSGGPIFMKCDKTKSDVQVGVVSWGFGCAYAGIPGVYARSFTEEGFAFIEEMVGNQGHSLNTVSSSSQVCGGTVNPPAGDPTPYPTFDVDAWTCSGGFFAGGDGCDCGCGMHDPDCDYTDRIFDCSTVENCVEGVCIDGQENTMDTVVKSTGGVAVGAAIASAAYYFYKKRGSNKEEKPAAKPITSPYSGTMNPMAK